jgi:NAD(P)-dependent dehydrogenase (short-subunit alcohol dehydrogenase family)
VPAAAGVGRALAACFASAGHDLILVSSDERDLRAMTADLMIRYRVRACPVAADVSDGDCYLERIASAANEMGGMDGLLFPIGAVAATDDCTFDIDRVAWGSVAAVRGRRRNVAYSAAKRALQSFFESLRHACVGSSVTVQFYVHARLDGHSPRQRTPYTDPQRRPGTPERPSPSKPRPRCRRGLLPLLLETGRCRAFVIHHGGSSNA